VLKRKALENDCTEVVHLPGTIGDDKSDRDSFLLWLRVRKNQWQVQRRKRQRTIAASLTDRATDADGDNDKLSWSGQSKAVLGSSAQKAAASHTSELSVIIDALLENQERERKVRVARPPLDIAFLFDSELGVPDDIVANVFSFLHCTEHGKLLCIDRTTRRRLMTRDQVWQQLCPSHWKLPRRPRKPWHELYLSNLRIETERSRKQWDDALLRGCEMLQGRGQFQQLKHLVDRAQKTCQFDINYSSGVVCERNSLLNLAVIHGKLSKFDSKGSI
jgi:hypothetical protein